MGGGVGWKNFPADVPWSGGDFSVIDLEFALCPKDGADAPPPADGAVQG
jgi:hypothetical protein